MKQITKITRDKIFDLFCNGYDEPSYLSIGIYDEPIHIYYPYFGKLKEVDFLKKIYLLSEMSCLDKQYSNAELEIYHHTEKDKDWKEGWIFYDSRFGLCDGDDETLLKFLCSVFHPENRDENGYWKEYLGKIQKILRPDGYELYVEDYISNEEVYNYRELTEVERKLDKFIPFSQRYNKNINVPKIARKKRNAIIELMCRNDENIMVTSETGFNSYKLISEIVLDEISDFYIPKAFNEEGVYCEEDNFYKFIYGTSPKSVFDAIELYSKYGDKEFIIKLNEILSDIGYKLCSNKIMPVKSFLKIENTSEPNLNQLIQQAESFYKKEGDGNKQFALEKLWDVLERLKTYYSTDKKKSIGILLDKISKNDINLKNILNDEFKKITDIGNEYQIRHFEKGKILISDVKIKEYLYARCLALINLSIKSINDEIQI